MEAAARCADQLRRYCKGEVFAGGAVPAALARDFGGMVERRPALVLRPAQVSDLALALRCAAEHELDVTVRGAGHSQSGQCLGVGLLLDLTGFNRVSVSTSAALVEAEAGATWHSIVTAAAARHCMPLAPTHALDMTIAGTLSVGGLGAESFRHGAQVDQVAYFDVLVPDGRVIRCDRVTERSLFDAVRAGLGQCGVVVRVGYPLRRCKRQLLTRCFAFTEPERFLLAARELAGEDSSAGWLAGAIRSQPGRARPILYLLLGQECDSAADAPKLGDLGEDFELPARVFPTWTPARAAGHPFFRVFGSDGGQARLNPWVDHLFGESDASSALAAFLTEPHEVARRGTTNLGFVRRGDAAAPLLRAPAGELLLCISALPVFDVVERLEAEEIMLAYAERARARGGFRYLSGFLGPMVHAAWLRQFGEAWPAFKAAKERHDPAQLLNPGLIDWG